MYTEHCDRDVPLPRPPILCLFVGWTGAPGKIPHVCPYWSFGQRYSVRPRPAGQVDLREPGSALLFTLREDIIDDTSKKNGADLKAVSLRSALCSCRLRINDPPLGEQ